MDQGILLTILILMAGVIAMLVYFLLRKKSGEKPQDNQAILMIQDQLKEMRQTLQNFGSQVENKMGDSAKMFQQQFAQSAKIVRDVTERLTKPTSK